MFVVWLCGCVARDLVCALSCMHLCSLLLLHPCQQVKDRLLFEQKKITAVEERRKQQENRKFSKALKSHKAKEKTEDKRRTLDAVKAWKKDKAQRYVPLFFLSE